MPYSQLVFDMQKTNPEVYVSRLVLRMSKEEVDMTRFRQAIEQAFRNHPIFQMHVDAKGMQRLEPLPDVLHGQYHAIDIEEYDAYADVHIQTNRILGDGWSDVVLFEDVVRAYEGLPLQPDNYLGYLQHIEEMKLTPYYSENRRWLESRYGDISCPVHPKTDAPISDTDEPIEGTYTENYSNIQESYAAFASAHLLSLTAFFSLACALAMMDYNDTDAAALTWAYDGRERPDEQRIFGSLHRDIPFQINHQSSIINHKSDLIRQARNQFRNGIAHSSYPFTLTKPHTEIWNYALNVLVQPFLQEIASLPFTIEDVTPQNESRMAYSLLDVEIIETEQLMINYRYSATHYKPESIQRFAALVRKYAEWLLEE